MVFVGLRRGVGARVGVAVVVALTPARAPALAARSVGGRSPVARAGSSVVVWPAKVRPSGLSGMREWQPAGVVWPRAGSAVVSLVGAAGESRLGVEAPVGQAAPGGLPVWLDAGAGQARHATAELTGAPVVGSVRVAVQDQRFAARAGVRGVVLALSRADGLVGGAPVRVRVGYGGFRDAFGGDFAGRLRLVRLPLCVLSAPELAACQVRTPLESVNDQASATVSGLVVVSGEPTVLAVTSSSSSAGGTWTATDLSQAASWSAGGQAGDFGFSYPFAVPASLGGPAPELALQYSSGSVDGQTLAVNGAPKWVGEGWDLPIGYVERAYRACAQDSQNVHLSGDVCWGSNYNATLVWNGRATPLVRNDTDGVWHAADDDALKIELLTDTSLGNGDDNGEYWKITTLDGTQYFFGRHKRYASDPSVTNSVLTVPVYANDPGEPCYQPVFASAWCRQAWRWGLDYVVDAHGNSMTVFYTKFSGFYGRDNNSAVSAYDLAGNVDRIEYGTRAGSEGQGPAPMRVVFGKSNRCQGACVVGSADYPDTPWDLYCSSATSCPSTTSPVYFNPYMLTSVTTQVHVGGAYRNVDRWDLAYSFPPSGDYILPAGDDTSPNLWLRSITRTGFAGDGSSVSEPATTFTGVQMINRVNWGNDIDVAPYVHYRISAIDNGVGGQTLVWYSGQECTHANPPPPTVDDNNPYRCFMQYFKPALAPAGWDWFHKYVVTSVTERDLTGGSADETWSYSYSLAGSSSSALWHHDNAETVDMDYRQWTEWRGYTTVTVTHGSGGGGQEVTVNRYYRGMDGDRTHAGWNTRRVTISDSQTSGLVDEPALRGWLRESTIMDGSSVVSSTIRVPQVTQTASRAAPTAFTEPQRAYMVRQIRTMTRTWIAATASWRWTQVDTSYNSPYGLPTSIHDYGDLAVADDDMCTTTSYVTPDTTKWLVDFPAETLTTTCAANPTDADYLSGSRVFYDGSASLGATPTRGLVTKTMALADVTGGVMSWAQTGRATFDANGRVLDSFDALDRRTSTSYTPPAGGPLTAIATTNPAGWTSTSLLDPGRGLPTQVIDVNGKTTTAAYDPLGRLTEVYLPHSGGGGGTSGYTTATASQSFIPATNQVTLSGDEGFAQLSLPFGFSFYGQTYTSVWMSTNGYLSFTDHPTASGINTAIPNPAAPNAGIYAFWDDLLFDATATAWTALVGSAPNRQFIIEWRNVNIYGTGFRLSFEVILSENGQITFNYTDITMTKTRERGDGATIGVENADGSAVTQYSYNQAILENGTAIIFTPQNPPPTSQPDLRYSYTLSGTTPNAVKTERLGPNGNRVITDMRYDNRGLTTAESVFYNNASAPSGNLVAFADADVPRQTRYLYDNLARPTAAILLSHGTEKWRTTTSYDGDRTMVTPPAGGTVTTTLFDAAGRTTQLRQHHGGVPSGDYDTTTYSYDRLDRLVTITDPAGNQWHYQYDRRGRKTQAIDPDTGTSTFTYNDAGELVTATDGRGQTIANVYDVLGRPVERRKDSLAGDLLASWTYDTLAKGRLTSATRLHDGNAYITAVTGYDDGYRPLGTTITIPAAEGALAGTYTFTTTYRVDGSPATQTFPAAGGLPAETVTTNYTDAGLPSDVAGLDAYLSAVVYHWSGVPVQQTLGTGASRVRLTTSIEEATGRLVGMQTHSEHPGAPDTWDEQLTEIYGYDPGGNVATIGETTGGATVSRQCFTYDYLRRLTEAWTTTATDCAGQPRGGWAGPVLADLDLRPGR